MNKIIKKTVLVAGAGGYLGTMLVPKLLEKNFKVIALDRYYFGDVYDQNTDPNLIVVKDDVRYFNHELLNDVWAVVNLAAISNDPASELNPKITQDVNYKGAVSLAKKAKTAGVERYILASSCSVYGHSDEFLTEQSDLAPISEYAKSKISAEKEILSLADKSFYPVALRMGTLHGLSPQRMRFDLIVNLMTLHAWKNNKIFIMGGGKQWRPLLHVEDAVDSYLTILEHKNPIKWTGEIFNVGNDTENYQVYQVAEIFKTYFPSLSVEQTPDDPDKRNYKVTFSKIRDVLGFKTSRTVINSIVDIKNSLESGQIIDDLRTKTVNYYQHLIESDLILSKIKIKNKIF